MLNYRIENILTFNVFVSLFLITVIMKTVILLCKFYGYILLEHWPIIVIYIFVIYKSLITIRFLFVYSVKYVIPHIVI